MKRKRRYKKVILILMTLAAAVLFLVLNSDLGRRRNETGLQEDKSIYTRDNKIYDVYIRLFHGGCVSALGRRGD